MRNVLKTTQSEKKEKSGYFDTDPVTNHCLK